jgi:sugar phosphate isomerase/epimerase
MAIRIGCAALYPITRYGFPYSFDDYLKAVAELHSVGFDACELEINVDLDLEEYIARKAEVLETLRRNEMTLSAIIGVVNGGFSQNERTAERYLELYRRYCGFAREVGCDNVCICAYMPPEIEGVAGTEAYRGSPPLQVRVPTGFEWESFWANAVHRLGQMARIAAGHGQRLIIENRVGDFVSTSDGVLKLIEDAGELNVGCLLDLAHCHATKEHFDLVIPKLKHRLAYVHLADNDGSFSYHLPAGRGNIDFPAIFRSLLGVGFAGYANVDYGGVAADEILEEVRRGREHFTSCLATVEAGIASQ